MTKDRDRKRHIRLVARRDGVSYVEARRRVELEEQATGWRYPPVRIEVCAMSPTEAAVAASWLRVYYLRRLPTDAQIRAMPDAARASTEAERRTIESQQFIGRPLGELRRLHPDARWRYVTPRAIEIVYDLQCWAKAPDHHLLVTKWDLHASIPPEFGPHLGREHLPVPSSSEIDAAATALSTVTEQIADALGRTIVRSCRGDVEEIRKVFRHGQAHARGLGKWDGGEFHGGDAASRLALQALRVALADLVGLSPWPTVEVWEQASNHPEHDDRCAALWRQLQRRCGTELDVVRRATVGIGKALISAKCRIAAIRRPARDGLVPYNRNSIVSFLLFHSGGDHVWEGTGLERPRRPNERVRPFDIAPGWSIGDDSSAAGGR